MLLVVVIVSCYSVASGWIGWFYLQQRGLLSCRCFLFVTSCISAVSNSLVVVFLLWSGLYVCLVGCLIVCWLIELLLLSDAGWFWVDCWWVGGCLWLLQ